MPAVLITEKAYTTSTMLFWITDQKLCMRRPDPQLADRAPPWGSLATWQAEMCLIMENNFFQEGPELMNSGNRKMFCSWEWSWAKTIHFPKGLGPNSKKTGVTCQLASMG